MDAEQRKQIEAFEKRQIQRSDERKIEKGTAVGGEILSWLSFFAGAPIIIQIALWLVGALIGGSIMIIVHLIRTAFSALRAK